LANSSLSLSVCIGLVETEVGTNSYLLELRLSSVATIAKTACGFVRMDTNAVPSVLLPICFRSGSRFRSLQRYNFTSEEKIWVCKNIVDSCVDMDTPLMHRVELFCDQYDISCRYIMQWLDAYANGEDFEDALLPIDHIGIKVITDCLNKGTYDNESESDFSDRLVQVYIGEVGNTTERRS